MPPHPAPAVSPLRLIQDGLRAREVALQHARNLQGQLQISPPPDRNPEPRPQQRGRSRGVHSQTSSSARRNRETQEQVELQRERAGQRWSCVRGALAWNNSGKLSTLQADNERMADAIQALERKAAGLSIVSEVVRVGWCRWRSSQCRLGVRHQRPAQSLRNARVPAFE